MYEQVRKANLNQQGAAHYCLRFTRQAYGIPAVWPTAWLAYKATKKKHTTALPAVQVPVWFRTKSGVGHVAIWVPGKGVLSSPASGYGQAWFKTVHELESRWGITYVGWSEDLNGRTVVRPL